MKQSRKAIALILSFILAVSVLPISAVAAIRVNNTFAAGTYTGVGIGHEEGEVTVSLTIGEDESGNKVITDISADGSSQTPGFWKRVEGLLTKIKENNGTEGVDVVTGATQSSSALLTAAEEALAKAQYTFFASGAGTTANRTACRLCRCGGCGQRLQW